MPNELDTDAMLLTKQEILILYNVGASVNEAQRDKTLDAVQAFVNHRHWMTGAQILSDLVKARREAAERQGEAR